MAVKWRLLSDSKNSILTWWYILSAFLIVFVLIQQITGKIEGIENQVWLWVFVHILPCAVLLNTYVFVNKYSDKAIHAKIHNALLGGSIGFFALVLLTFFCSQAAIDMNDYGLDVYFIKSYKYLLPFNILLLTAMGFVFYTQKNFLKPANEAVISMAQNKALEAVEKGKNNRKNCLNFLVANDFDRVFETMKALFSGKEAELTNHVLLLQAQYNQIIEDRELNIVEPDKAQATLNRLTIGLINLTESIDS